ncbi:hypothetical protein B9Z55_026725 [Caenorhabditis nigoni]|nr:hypothetical protein B9Z55_026725 [Caenorhabditis nigoni]
MKLLILPLLLVSTAYSNAPMSLQGCADEINVFRSKYANELSVANMNKLVYNPKLEKKILEKLESSGGCPEKYVEYEDGFIFGLNVIGSDGLQVKMASNAGSMEVACVQTKCENSGKVIISAVFDFEKSPILAGPPGTRCSGNRTADSNGLCALETSRKSGKYVRKGPFRTIGRGLGRIFG